MEILINREYLREALQKIIPVIDKSATKPILSNFLLKTSKDGTVEFSATDHELSIVESFPAQIIAEGKICINARRIHDICRELQGEEVHIRSTEQLWIHITSGKSELRLPSVEVGLYPNTVLEDFPEKLIIDSETLKKCIDQTLFAAITNESRKNLMGVALSLVENKQVRWLATDGHRLAQLLQPVEQATFTEVSEVIVPRKALTEVRKVTDSFGEKVEISFDDRSMQFKGAQIAFKTRLIEGKFPNCDPIIPKSSAISVVVNRDALIRSLKIVSSISNEKLKSVKMTLSQGKMKLESEKADYGEVEDQLDVEYDASDFQIGFNSRYLLDVLNVLTGSEIRMEFNTNVSPCLVKDPSDATFLSVIMPLRIE